MLAIRAKIPIGTMADQGRWFSRIAPWCRPAFRDNQRNLPSHGTGGSPDSDL